MEELLPRLGADRIAEQCAIVPTLQPVVATVLLVAPTLGQVRDRVEFVIGDSPGAHGGPQDPVAPEQLAEIGPLDDSCIAGAHGVGSTAISSSGCRMVSNLAF